MSFLKALLVALTLSATPAFAQDFPAADRAAMTARVDDFNAAFRSGDMAAIFDFMPPKVLSNLATQSGMEEEALLAAIKDQIDAAMAIVTIDSFAMDIDGSTYSVTPDGSRPYALIPTETIMTVEGAGKMRATSETLAFADAGIWYLVRIDEAAQVTLLTDAYPEFKGISFAPGTLTTIE